MTGNDVRNQINTTTFGLIEALNERNGHCIWLDFSQKRFAEVRDELMWHNENEYVSVFAGFNEIGYSDLKKTI